MKERIRTLKEVITKKGLDGLLVMNEKSIFYLTKAMGANFLIIPKNGRNFLYVYSVNYEAVKREAENCIVKLIKRGEKIEEEVAEKIENLKIKNVGFDTLSAEIFLQLRRLLRGKAKLKFKNELIWGLREVKDKEEIELIRKAAEITSIGMRTAYEVLKPGITEIEVAAEIEYAMRKAGSWGLAFDTIVASGLRSAYPHGWCTDKKIKKGELVVIDIGATYRNYRADMTRTLVAGKPSKKQEKIFNIVKEAQEKAFQSIKSSRKACDIDKIARKIIEDADYGEYFVHGLGHGVGLEVHEPPTLSSQSKDKLKAGNVVTVEPGIYIVGFGGVRIEDTVLVKRKGAEKLTRGPYTLTLG